MHISKGEFLALIFVLWENHARRTRKVQIIKMQKVERLNPGLNLPVLMPFNPLKGLDDPGGELFGSLKGMLFVLHPLNQSTGLLLSIPMDSEREEGDWVVFFFFSFFLLLVLLLLCIFYSQYHL